MFHKRNGNHFIKLLIKIGSAFVVGVAGIAILCSLGLYALISILVGSAIAKI